jgi:hypothetical protein
LDFGILQELGNGLELGGSQRISYSDRSAQRISYSDILGVSTIPENWYRPVLCTLVTSGKTDSSLAGVQQWAAAEGILRFWDFRKLCKPREVLDSGRMSADWGPLSIPMALPNTARVELWNSRYPGSQTLGLYMVSRDRLQGSWDWMYSNYIIGTVLSDPRVCNYPINREIIYRVFQVLCEQLLCRGGAGSVQCTDPVLSGYEGHSSETVDK